MNVAIVIPTFNERESMPRLLAGLDRVVKNQMASLACSLIVVDDDSSDGTTAMVPPHSTLIVRRGMRGLGSALVTGFRRALADGADVIVEMDADGSHDPRDIPRLLDAIAAGADVAIGSRRVPGGRIEGWNARRHAMSWGAMAVARVILDIRTRDVTNGFRAYRRTVFERIGLDRITSNGYAFQEEILFRAERAGFRVSEVPTTFRDRTLGSSKLSARDVGEFFITLFRLWRLR